MRTTVIIVAGIALALLAVCEIALAYPVAWWLYVVVAVVLTAGLIRPVPVRRQVARVGVLAGVMGVMAALNLVNWTTRKPFLRDVARIQAGMTEAEVRHIMGRYMEGTGWPASPFDRPGSRGTLAIDGSGSQYSTTTSSEGQMVIRNSLVYRHSNEGAFNSDWGIVSLADGRVTHVEFSPD